MDPAHDLASAFEDHDFRPCSSVDQRGVACGTTEFEARFYESQPKRIKIVCAQGHPMTSISGGHWVSRDFFLDDDRYSNMLPASWIASVPSERRDRSLELRATARTRAMLMRECVVCGTPPFDIAPPSVVHECLREYRPSSYAALTPYLQQVTTFATREWLDALPEALRELVRRLAQGSRVEADHLIPHHVLVLMKGSLSSEQHEIATSYALPMCADCNKDRGGLVYTTDALVHYYARAYRGQSRTDDADPQATLFRYHVAE